MDIDSEHLPPYPEDNEPETNRMYSLTIECESSPSTLYNPIRISDAWISDAIEKPTDVSDATVTIDNILDNAPSIDWQDPKPTYLEPTTESMDINSTPGRLPNIRFVAKFNPPLVVPLAVHMQLYQSVGLSERPEDFRATTFVGLALRPGEIDPGMMGAAGSTHEIRSTRSVLDSSGKPVHHAMSLYLPKIEYSRTLSSLPFAHPKQLVAILPILRQYALTTSLLCDAFMDKALGRVATLNDAQVQIDVNLTYTPPAPRLSFVVPHPSSTSASLSLDSLMLDTDTPSTPPLAVTLDIHANAEIVVSEQNVVHVAREVDMDKAEEGELRVKRLGRGLDVCGDLGVWGEWLRGEARRG